jgi:hypothetical protein
MLYITKTFYMDEYKGRSIPEKLSSEELSSKEQSSKEHSFFDRIAQRASESLNAITYGRIERKGFENFEPSVQYKIRMAACAIAESAAQIEAINASSGGAVKTSESVTGYSYTISETSVVKIEAEGYKRAVSYLIGTNLLYVGVS